MHSFVDVKISVLLTQLIITLWCSPLHKVHKFGALLNLWSFTLVSTAINFTRKTNDSKYSYKRCENSAIIVDFINIYGGYTSWSGPGSIVGIATDYELDGPEIESRWGAKFSAPVQTGPGADSASSTMGTGSFPGRKSGRSVTLTPHPLQVPWSWKSRAIPLLPLWAVRPVLSLSACTWVHFTFTLLYIS
jgi:hypothetical protein